MLFSKGSSEHVHSHFLQSHIFEMLNFIVYYILAIICLVLSNVTITCKSIEDFGKL